MKPGAGSTNTILVDTYADSTVIIQCTAKNLIRPYFWELYQHYLLQKLTVKQLKG